MNAIGAPRLAEPFETRQLAQDTRCDPRTVGLWYRTGDKGDVKRLFRNFRGDVNGLANDIVGRTGVEADVEVLQAGRHAEQNIVPFWHQVLLKRSGWVEEHALTGVDQQSGMRAVARAHVFHRIEREVIAPGFAVYSTPHYVVGRPNFLRSTARQGQWQADDKITTVHVFLDGDQCEENQEDNETTFLDIKMKIVNKKIKTEIYDKREDYNFKMVKQAVSLKDII